LSFFEEADESGENLEISVFHTETLSQKSDSMCLVLGACTDEFCEFDEGLMMCGVVFQRVQITLKRFLIIALTSVKASQEMQNSIILNVNLAVVFTELDGFLKVLIFEIHAGE
jgi:hypothetical protein